jgi:hypothetical protein
MVIEHMKAEVGDFIRFDGVVRRVARQYIGDLPDEKFYEMEDGSLISDAEIMMDDVLLESEVIH